MKPNTPDRPPVPQAPPSVDDAAVQDAARREYRIAAAAKGRSSTLLAGGGLGDPSKAPTRAATLLGA